MGFKIPLLQELPSVQDITDGTTLFKIDDWLQFLRKHKKDDAPPKTSNTLRYFQQNLSAREKDNVKCVTLSGVLQYCYHYRYSRNVCKEICRQVEQCIIKGPATANATAASSVKEVYDAVCQFDFGKSKQMWHHLNEAVDLTSLEIPTLMSEHSALYTSEQWQTICYFEWHFYQQGQTENLSHEEQVNARWSFFISLQKIHDVSVIIQRDATTTVKRRQKRKIAALASSIQLSFDNGHQHMPSQIEVSLLSNLQDLVPNFDGSILLFDCTHECAGKHNHGGHVYLEFGQEVIQVSHDLIAQFIVNHLAKHHGITVYQVLFFKHGSFAHNAEGTSRFHVRDQIIAHHLHDQQVSEWILPGDYPLPLDDSMHENGCKTCKLKDCPEKSLHWSNFKLEFEWYTDTPLSIQLILEGFVNKRTLSATKDTIKYMKKKTNRLYSVFDTLLNTHNNKHTGMIQEINTTDLLVNYNSLKHSFHINQTMGSTRSFDAAEREWKKQSSEEMAYYNYAIRKEPLTYRTIAGMQTKFIGLRDCYVLAMRDNLVSLTQRADPEPGISRTGQICTIQGTDIGIPKDSGRLQDYHTAPQCDGSSSCTCMQPVSLGFDDLESTLLAESSDEASVMDRFRQMCTWSLGKVWKSILIGNIPYFFSTNNMLESINELAGSCNDLSCDAYTKYKHKK